MPIPIGPETSWICPSLNPTQTGSPNELISGVAINSTTGTNIWTPDTAKGGTYSVTGGEDNRNAVSMFGLSSASSPVARYGFGFWQRFPAGTFDFPVSALSPTISFFSMSGQNAASMVFMTSVTGSSQWTSSEIELRLVLSGPMFGYGMLQSTLKIIGQTSNGMTAASFQAAMEGWNHWFVECDFTRGASSYQNGTMLNANPLHRLYLNGQLLDTGGTGTGPCTVNEGTMQLQDGSHMFFGTVGSTALFNAADEFSMQSDTVWDDARFFANTLPTSQELLDMAASRGAQGPSPVGLGGEKLWLCPSLNNSADDISGNGNNGTYQGGMTTVADTSNGGSLAYDFDGTDDRIDLPSTVLGGSQVFSMACWVYVDSHDQNDGQGYMGQVELGSPAGSNDVAALYSGGWNTSPDFVSTSWRSITFAGGSYGYTSVPSSYSPPTGSWHHIACVADGSVNTLYVDGVAQLYPSSYTGSFPTPSSSFQIGRYGSSNNGCLDGRMDDCRAYHRALTQSEIIHLASQRGVEGPPPVGLGDEQLWLCPSLNDSANDISGYGNDGTYQGGMGTIADVSNGGSRAYEFTASVQNVIKTGFDFGGKTNFSWSAWIYDDRRSVPTNAHNAYFSFSGRGTAQYSHDIYFFSLQGEQWFQVNNGADGGNRYTDGLQVWKHMAVIYDGTEAVASDRFKYYENGVQVTPTSTFNYPTSVPTNTASPDTQIGGYAMTANSTHWFTGKQDDIRIFDRSLTQSEITHLAEARGIEGPPPVGLGDEQLWLCPSLNDSANDISGSGNNGTYQNGMGTIADVSNGGSLAYDLAANEDRIEITGIGSSWRSSGAWTISMWLKGMLAQNNQALVLNGNVNLYRGSTSGEKLQSQQLNPIAGTGYTATGVATGTWYHLVCTSDGTNMKMYADGVEFKSIAAGLATTNAGDMTFGSTAGQSPSGTPIVRFDDIRAYDRALTQSEITHLASSRGVEGPPPVGLGDETLWLCASLNQSSPTSEISGAGLTITEEISAGGTLSLVADTGAGGTHSVEFANGTSNCLLAIDNFGNTYSEVTSVSWWSRRTAGSTVIEIGLDTDLWPSVATSRFFYQNSIGIDRAYMYNTSGGTNGWIEETMSNSTWKHHVMVREGVGGKNRLYINGVLDTQEYDDGGAETTGKDMYFGIGGGGSASSEIYMDDIRTYGRALTQSEITHLATSRGIEGGPSTPDVFFNPFKSTTFQNQTFNNGGIGE